MPIHVRPTASSIRMMRCVSRHLHRCHDMSSLNRFAAKLLFQYRVGKKSSSKFRTCEERIILLRERTPFRALAAAKKVGRMSEATYLNDDRVPVVIEFVGVLDLMELGIEAAGDEVWYEIKTMLRPMERKSKLIPPERELSAIKGAVKRHIRVRLDHP